MLEQAVNVRHLLVDGVLNLLVFLRLGVAQVQHLDELHVEVIQRLLFLLVRVELVDLQVEQRVSPCKQRVNKVSATGTLIDFQFREACLSLQTTCQQSVRTDAR